MTRRGSRLAAARLAAGIVAAGMALLASWPGAAQQLVAPGGGVGSAPSSRAPRALPPQQTLMPMTAGPRPSAPAAAATTGGIPLTLAARFGREATTQITNGLLWRIFPAKPDA